jgi:hypothetical protein
MMLMVQDATDEIRRQQQHSYHTAILRKNVQVMRKSVAASQGSGKFIGKSAAMHHVYEQILVAAACTAS